MADAFQPTFRQPLGSVLAKPNDRLGPVLSAISGGGGGDYVADAVSNDATAYLSATLATPAGRALSWCYFAKFTNRGVDNKNMVPFSFGNDPDFFGANSGYSTAYTNISAYDVGGPRDMATGFDITHNVSFDEIAFDTDVDAYSFGQWVFIAGAIDTDHPNGEKIYCMRVNDSVWIQGEGEASDGSGGAFDILFAGAFEIFRVVDFGGGEQFRCFGDFADLTIIPNQYIDWSDSATTQLFRTVAGKPVDPSVAAAALGLNNSNSFRLFGGSAGWIAQAALLGLTITGSLPDASTSPSD